MYKATEHHIQSQDELDAEEFKEQFPDFAEEFENSLEDLPDAKIISTFDREVIQDISGLFLEFTNEGNSFSNLWDQSYERSFNMAADFHEDKKFQSSKKKSG